MDMDAIGGKDIDIIEIDVGEGWKFISRSSSSAIEVGKIMREFLI